MLNKHSPNNKDCVQCCTAHPCCTCTKEEPVDGKKVNKDYLRGYEQGKFDAEMDRLNMKEPVEGWEEEFEKLMPKASTDGISYPQFCAVREFVASQITKAKEQERREALTQAWQKMETDIRAKTVPHAVEQAIAICKSLLPTGDNQ